MESAFDAQNLISISLRKIQSSRTQRGGIKLHKNLLVTYVLRNARQLCMSRNLSHQYEAAAAVRAGHEHLELTGGFPDLADDFYCNFAGLESDGEPAEAQQQEAAALPPGDSELLAPDACWSCADKPSWESPVPSAQVSQKTVLDLDTHVVTTVTNGYLHPDCCCAHSRGRKRRMELHVVEPDFYLPDLGPVPCKRMRTDEDADSSNLCTLVSVLGSGGLCEFVSWQQTELEQILSPQTVALKHTLLTGWTRAIEAF